MNFPGSNQVQKYLSREAFSPKTHQNGNNEEDGISDAVKKLISQPLAGNSSNLQPSRQVKNDHVDLHNLQERLTLNKPNRNNQASSSLTHNGKNNNTYGKRSYPQTVMPQKLKAIDHHLKDP